MSVYSSLPERKINGCESETKLPFGLDRDTLLVAALLFLMLKENSDMKLILALVYILM